CRRETRLPALPPGPGAGANSGAPIGFPSTVHVNVRPSVGAGGGGSGGGGGGGYGPGGAGEPEPGPTAVLAPDGPPPPPPATKERSAKETKAKATDPGCLTNDVESTRPTLPRPLKSPVLHLARRRHDASRGEMRGGTYVRGASIQPRNRGGAAPRGARPSS